MRRQETIGERLRRLRLERGLSQRELSGPGVSYAYISRIEAGERRPSVKALRILAAGLGVSADYLETGADVVTLRLDRDLACELLRQVKRPVRARRELAASVQEALSDGCRR